MFPWRKPECHKGKSMKCPFTFLSLNCWQIPHKYMIKILKGHIFEKFNNKIWIKITKGHNA